MKIVKLVSFVPLLFLLLVGQASAVVIRTSDVSTVVTPLPGGGFEYNYTVTNTSPAPQFEAGIEVWPLIVDYEVPLDDPSVVRNVLSPDGWAFEFISADEYLFRFGEANPFGSPWVLHWFTGSLPAFATAAPLVIALDYKPIAPTGYNARFETSFYEPSTDGFIFESDLAPVNGPYLTSWFDDFRNIGDPPLPGGLVGGGGTPPFTAVSVPQTLALFAMGFVSLLLGRRRCAVF